MPRAPLSILTDSTLPKLLVGLGNPGTEYANTWHNAGRQFLALAQEQHQKFFLEHKIHTLLPTSYMNENGRDVAAKSHYLRIPPEQILLAFDDLDIELGQYKVQFAHYPKEHGGVNSVIAALGSDQFYCLRLGISSPEFRELKQSHNVTGRDYVLSHQKAQSSLLRSAMQELSDYLFGSSAS